MKHQATFQYALHVEDFEHVKSAMFIGNINLINITHQNTTNGHVNICQITA